MAGTERCRIVAAHLKCAGAQRCCTVIFAGDNVGSGLEAAFEIRTYGSDEYQEEVFFCRLYTYLCGDADLQWTYVERSAAAIGRYEAFVEAYHLFHHLLKFLFWKRWHHNALGRFLDACGILVHAKHPHFAVFATKSLKPFKGFLTVVEASGSHMHWYQLRG